MKKPVDFSVWKIACRFCGKLAETDGCKECEEHFKSHGHHPKEIRYYRVTGQPRVIARYCGECGRRLEAL